MSTSTYIPLYYSQNYIPNYDSNVPQVNVENPLYLSNNYPLHSIVTEDFHNDVTYPVYKETYYHDTNNNINTEGCVEEESRAKMYPFYMALCCFAALSFTFGLYLILSCSK